MKRTGNLFDTFSSFPNLLKAYQKARRGTRSNQETSSFFLNQEAELLQLQEELQSLRYQPQVYRYFRIHDPKERMIAVAAFRDRVVHHALVNVLEPVYEPIFIHDSYATRKGKGHHQAILKAQQMLRCCPWFLKSDVDKYFDSISHDRMMQIIHSKIKDPRLLEITDRIIRNGGSEGYGLPIGNLTSQFFANVYLNELDYFVKQQLLVKHYLRYMDDFVLFDHSLNTLKAHRKAIEDFMAQELELRLKPSATYLNSASNGLTFLGRRIFPDLMRVARPNLQRIIKRIGIRDKKYQHKTIGEDEFLASMNSYWASLSFGDTHRLRKDIIKRWD